MSLPIPHTGTQLGILSFQSCNLCCLRTLRPFTWQRYDRLRIGKPMPMDLVPAATIFVRDLSPNLKNDRALSCSQHGDSMLHLLLELQVVRDNPAVDFQDL